MAKPLVSVCCITYNHAKFIEQCLDGFLMQKTSFDVEFLIHDDASTDNTQELITNKVSNDPRFKLILREKNIKSLGISVTPLLFEIAQGKYIALCEGDDYWVDCNKLKNQVDILEKNNDLTLVSSAFISIFNNKIIHNSNKVVNTSEKGFVFGLDLMNKFYLTKTLTLLFRANLAKQYLNVIKDFKYARDVHLSFFLLNHGNGFYLNDETGVFNLHDGGVNSLKSSQFKYKNAYLLYKEMSENWGCGFISLQLFKKSAGYLLYNIKNRKLKLSLLIKLSFTIIKSITYYLIYILTNRFYYKKFN